MTSFSTEEKNILTWLHKIVNIDAFNTSICMTKRIDGLDVARAIALFGMMIENFKVVSALGMSNPRYHNLLMGSIDGRSAPLFVILAGMGLSLMTLKAKKSGDPLLIRETRLTILKRGAFLTVFGYLFILIWQADILHYFGVYFAVGALLFTINDRRLLIAMIGFALGFVILIFIFNYDAGWDWETLTYLDLWTFSGFFRNLFFNGFHPIFPWTAFFLFGMWLARRDFNDPKFRGRLLFWGAVTFVTTEAISWGLVRFMLYLSGTVLPIKPEDIPYFFGTEFIPPMPFYLLSACGTAAIVIALSLFAMERPRASTLLRPLIAVGRMSLTIYVAHILVGMVILDAINRLEGVGLVYALVYAVVVFLLSVIFALFMEKSFSRGPLEGLMRWMTG